MASQYGVGKHPNSLANLQPKKPGYTPDPEVVKKAARIGGEKRHKRRLMRDAMKDILSSGLIDLDGDEQIAAIKAALMQAGIEDPTNADAISMAVGVKALRGDVEAARFVRDTSGEKPVQGVEVGNLDDRPFEHINLAELTDEQLFQMVAEADQDGE